MTWRLMLACAGIGLVVASVTWVSWSLTAHLYADHLLIDAIRMDAIQRHAQQPKPVEAK